MTQETRTADHSQLDYLFRTSDFQSIVQFVQSDPEKNSKLALTYACSYGNSEVLDFVLVEYLELLEPVLPFGFVTAALNRHDAIAEDLIINNYVDTDKIEVFVKLHNLQRFKQLIEEKKAKS